MKKHSIFLSYFIFSFFLSFYCQAETSSWEEQIFSKKVGSCETKNLNFTSLRFTKLSLDADSKYFLRVLIFLNADNTQSIRLTTQELLACQTSSDGTEVCSYRQISNEWINTTWSKNLETDDLNLEILGILHLNQNDQGLSIKFPANFSFPKLAGRSFFGKMVLVNFDSTGVNSSKLCN